MAKTRLELGDGAAAALAQFRMQEFETGLGAQLARLYEGHGFSPAEKAELLPLVAQLAPPAGDERWEDKPHQHLTFNQLLAASREEWGRPLLRKAYSWLKARGLANIFTVTSAELVARCGNPHPFHFDKATGALAYQQPALSTSDGKGMPSGLRLLLDVGDLPSGDERPLTFKLQKRSSREPRLFQPNEKVVEAAQQVHSTLAGAAFMDGAMAGSGGIGGMLHGREGSDTAVGATLSLDLAVARWGRKKGERGLALDSTSQRVAEFFSGTKPRNQNPQQGARGGGGRSGQGKAAEKAAERATAAASELGVALPAGGAVAAAPAAPDRMHCFWCHALTPGTGETCSWGTYNHNGTRRRGCVACISALNRNVLGSERPAAALCPGCRSCT